MVMCWGGTWSAEIQRRSFIKNDKTITVEYGENMSPKFENLWSKTNGLDKRKMFILCSITQKLLQFKMKRLREIKDEATLKAMSQV